MQTSQILLLASTTSLNWRDRVGFMRDVFYTDARLFLERIVEGRPQGSGRSASDVRDVICSAAPARLIEAAGSAAPVATAPAASIACARHGLKGRHRFSPWCA